MISRRLSNDRLNEKQPKGDNAAFSPETFVSQCRLLYLVGQLHTGGLERQLFYLLKTMDRERYRPAVVVWSYNEADLHVPYIRKLGVPLFSLPRGMFGLAKIKALRDKVKQIAPEVIHSYTFYTNIAAYWAARGQHTIALGSIRNDFLLDKKLSGPLLGRLSARWPAEQICNSYRAAQNARYSAAFFTPRQLHVVWNGLDLERFQSRPFLSNGPVRILAVGYLLPAKRWDRLLVAAKELKRQNLDFLIRIAGNGLLQEHLQQKAQTLGITDCVEFLGHRDDISLLLADSDFLVHTADNEGCPNAVMEAMACGRAVVAMDAGDVPSLVEDGITGFVVPRGNNQMLIDRMMKLISNRALCHRMGEAGRIKSEREFSLDRLVQETLAAYRVAGWKDAHR